LKTSDKICGLKPIASVLWRWFQQHPVGVAYLAIIYEFQGFDSVKKVLQYTLIFLLASTSFCLAQKTPKGGVTTALNFADSIRIVLENSRNVDATVIGGSFFSAWNGLGIDQQTTIQRQTALMKKKKLPLRPHMVDYFGALANAVSIEHADASKIDGFLKVAGKVIELEKPDKAKLFFNTSKTLNLRQSSAGTIPPAFLHKKLLRRTIHMMTPPQVLTPFIRKSSRKDTIKCLAGCRQRQSLHRREP
jgi:hypothetical protein